MSGDPNTTPPGSQPAPEEESQPPVIVLQASSDRMELVLILQKAARITLKPTYEDLKAAIAEQGVVFGVKKPVLQVVCSNPMFNHPITIAKGVPPATGKDGSLNYLIDTTRELRPKLRQDGTADFRDLGYVQNVRADQVLCEIHLAEKGADGKDIYGTVLEGKYGRNVTVPSGTNTHLNEDGTLLLASVNGHAEVLNGMIHVRESMQVKGNVDNSTGDIDFVGDLTILGDVVSGFKVSSEKNILVKGSVEGAELHAAGDIVVEQGINGMNRGVLIAGGNIKCKYIQSCTLQADANIYADSIMYCTLECGGNVMLDGKRATLIGGQSTIAGVLSAKTIGTSTHVQTSVTMASLGTKKNRELQEMEVEVKRIDNENVKLVQIMTRFEELTKAGRMDPEQAKSVATVKENYLAQKQRRQEITDQIVRMQEEMLEASKVNSYILCKDRVHSGVHISFGPLSMTVYASFVNSRIAIVDNDIRVMNL